MFYGTVYYEDRIVKFIIRINHPISMLMCQMIGNAFQILLKMLKNYCGNMNRKIKRGTGEYSNDKN